MIMPIAPFLIMLAAVVMINSPSPALPRLRVRGTKAVALRRFC
jgi:hypothetical protein